MCTRSRRSSAHLEDIRAQALNALRRVREEFEGSGGGPFEQAQMMINTGIDDGDEVIMRHSQRRRHALLDMITPTAPRPSRSLIEQHPMGRRTSTPLPGTSGALASSEREVMADLTTTPTGIWVLQALLGIETMPTTLRLRPFIPSVDAGPTVMTVAGERPLTQTAEYASLAAAGVIDTEGRVDDAVRDWMAVVGRPEREVMLVIRRPAPDAGEHSAHSGADAVDLPARPLAGHDRPQR